MINVLLVAEREERLKQADSIRFLTLLLQLPIEVEKEYSQKVVPDLLALGGTWIYPVTIFHILTWPCAEAAPWPRWIKSLFQQLRIKGVSILEA